MTALEICFYFLLYSFFGWCIEVAYHAVRNHKIINRGFLNGPVCPVYGFGVLLVFFLESWVLIRSGSQTGELPLPVLFLLGMFLATFVELVGGFALDKLFHARWWDYSGMPLNLHGYICLRFSLIWGLAIVLVVRLFDPLVTERLMGLLPLRVERWVLLGCYLLYLTDFIVSVMLVLQLNRELKELEEIRTSIRHLSDSLSLVVGEGTFLASDVMKGAEERLGEKLGRAEEIGPSPANLECTTDSDDDNLLETRDEFEEKKEKVILQYKENVSQTRQAAREKRAQALAQLIQRREAWHERFQRRSHFTLRRVMKAYPRFRHLQYDDLLQELRAEWEKRSKRPQEAGCQKEETYVDRQSERVSEGDAAGR